MNDQRKEDIQQGLNEIFSALLRDKEKEAEVVYGEVMQRLLNDYGTHIKKMDTFYFLIKYPIEEALEYLIRIMYPNLPERTASDIVFLYTYYDFYEHQIEGLIDAREGFVCVTDKSRWLLESYRHYLLEGTIPDMNIDEKCFWKPHFGTGEEWIAFMESLMPFYYGKPHAYLKSMAAFMQSVKEGKVDE